MNAKIFLIAMLLAFVSCEYKNTNKTNTAPQGTYKGQFIRSSPLARYAPSDVTITFAGNTFTGESEKPNYPAIGKGTFKVNGQDIVFTNDVMWTAEFDWSYILKDKWELNMIGDKLEMTKKVGDTTDHYSLTLQ